jgi:hypothetical protein
MRDDPLNEYEIRRGLQDNIKPENLRQQMVEVFGNAQEKDGRLVASYGAIKEIWAWTSGKKLAVDTKMAPGVDDKVAQDTIRAYNTFLEKVTGYTSKERGKRAQKAVKEGKA